MTMFKPILTIYKKELSDYFNSSIAYVFLVLFLLIPNIFFFHFFGGIFRENNATMRTYFAMLPFVFIVFIPGLTMGGWAKERNAGTLELLLTFPINAWQVLLGKFFASLTLVSIALASTITIPAFTSIAGGFDWGQIFTQYLGAIILAGCYISITLFLSSLTNELIDAFLISAALLLVLTTFGYLSMIVIFPAWLEWFRQTLVYLSLSTHFANFSKGVIDTRDILFYAGVTAIFFYLNLRSLETKKGS